MHFHSVYPRSCACWGQCFDQEAAWQTMTHRLWIPNHARFAVGYIAEIRYTGLRLPQRPASLLPESAVETVLYRLHEVAEEAALPYLHMRLDRHARRQEHPVEPLDLP